MHPEIIRNQEKLVHLYEQARILQSFKDIDDEVKAQFVWYLCIRTSGYVEYSVRTILLEFYEASTEHQPLGDFVIRQLRLSREFPMRRVMAIFQSLVREKGGSSGDFDYSKLDTTLQSIQQNRNRIAHGGDAYRLSMSDLDTYFAAANEVIRMVFEECNPSDTVAF